MHIFWGRLGSFSMDAINLNTVRVFKGGFMILPPKKYLRGIQVFKNLSSSKILQILSCAVSRQI